jgi:hypothetical protein
MVSIDPDYPSFSWQIHHLILLFDAQQNLLRFVGP